jgi:hypothetical protein
MTDLWTFARLLSDVAPSLEMIDGRLFLDRANVGPEALRAEISKYEDAAAAQQWINAVPIDDFIDCAVSDWSIDDPLVEHIGGIYARSWLAEAKAKYGTCSGLTVQVLKDQDSGDVVVRLTQA